MTFKYIQEIVYIVTNLMYTPRIFSHIYSKSADLFFLFIPQVG